MRIQTIAEAAKDKLPELPARTRWGAVRYRLMDRTSCPTCENDTLVCLFIDLSAPEMYIYDNHCCHICLNAECRYAVHVKGAVRYVGQESKYDGICPFCKVDMFAQIGPFSERLWDGLPWCVKCRSERFTLSRYWWYMTQVPGIPRVSTKFWCCRDCGFTAGKDTPKIERRPECPGCASPLRYQVVNIDDTNSTVPGEGEPLWGLRCHTCSFQVVENDDLD